MMSKFKINRITDYGCLNWNPNIGIMMPLMMDAKCNYDFLIKLGNLRNSGCNMELIMIIIH